MNSRPETPKTDKSLMPIPYGSSMRSRGQFSRSTPPDISARSTMRRNISSIWAARCAAFRLDDIMPFGSPVLDLVEEAIPPMRR